MAAQFATPEAVNFMAKHGRGLICLALTAERCDELGLDLMTAKNEAPLQTAFTVSIEAARGRHHRHLAPTTAPARSRSRSTRSSGPRRPGPARPHLPAAGEARRRARAHRPDRGGVDLARLAGPDPGRRDLRDHERRRHDGARARPRVATAREHDLKIVTVADLIAYRRRTRSSSSAIVSTQLPTGVRRLHGGRLPLAGRRQAPRGAGQGRGRRRRRRARPRALRVPDRRRLPLACAATAASSSRPRWRRSRPRAAACCSTSPRRAAASAC